MYIYRVGLYIAMRNNELLMHESQRHMLNKRSQTQKSVLGHLQEVQCKTNLIHDNSGKNTCYPWGY